VLFGGASSERDVSVATAAQVVPALRAAGHEVLAVETHRGVLDADEELAVLSRGIDSAPPSDARSAMRDLVGLIDTAGLSKVDLVFLALHGGAGEDGTVQGALDLAGVRYTGTGMLGSALAMDKDMAKRLFIAQGVPTPKWLMAPVAPELAVERLGLPLIVKPNAEGSTVGLSLVTDAAHVQPAVEAAAAFDTAVMIEQYIPGRELTVGILDDAPLAVGEIEPLSGEIFDYQAKYQQGAAREIFPAELDEDRAHAAQALALRAHRALKLGSYSRVDFRMDPQGGLWCLEVNTLPGLTTGSLLPQAALASGISFAELCERICRAACASEHRADTQ